MQRNVDAARYRTAIHEAGHLVVGGALGLWVGTAKIEQEGTREGWCQVDNPCLGWEGPGRAAAIRSFIVTAMAGAEAEKLFFGEADGGDWSDREAIERALWHIRIKGCSYVGDDAWRAEEARLRRRARRLCQSLRLEIETTAQSLVDEGDAAASFDVV